MADETSISRRRRVLRATAILLVVVTMAAVALLWIERVSVAQGVIDDMLAERGVAARYEVTRLGVTRQRIENVVIGDPANPDLTAEWAEVTLRHRFGTPRMSSISAGGVRLYGRLIDGRLTLGAVDRLLPAPSGAPFALPDLTVRLADARMRLDTAAGQIGLSLDGRGNLAGGFVGRLGAVAPRLALGGCVLRDASAFVDLAIVDRAPAFDGPLRVAAADCGGVRASGLAAAADATLTPALDGWRGSARVQGASVKMVGSALRGLSGRIDFSGNAAGTGGTAALAAAARADGIGAGRVAVDGRYRVGAELRADGLASVSGLVIAPARVADTRHALRTLSGTPLVPLGIALSDAVAAAAGSIEAQSGFAAVQRADGGGGIVMSGLRLASASGATLAGERATRIGYGWRSGRGTIDGRLALSGGGMPSLMAALTPMPGGGHRGTILAEPYAAGDARLALTRVTLTNARGATRFATRANLDGPLAGGRVTGLDMPLAGELAADGAFRVNPGCVPFGFDTLAIAGARFGALRTRLCPTGPALASGGGGRPLAGGARIAGPALAGRLGREPLTIGARELRVAFDRAGFVAEDVAVRLGVDSTRIDMAAIGGTIDARGVGGAFRNLGGRIAKVPLLLSDGAGEWRLEDSVVTLGGRVVIFDELKDSRFEPVASDDLTLRFANDVIRAGGTLVEPATRIKLSDVTIEHRLSTGRGHADLIVPGIRFTPTLQPDQLTRSTIGVIANVAGTVAGRGRIAWTPAGATSSGAFSTERIDLAAAFGPVTGIAGTIRFSDLLGLTTPPGQLLTVAEINSGIAVAGGVVRYRLLPDLKVRVEDARWPFSGGTLTLDPALLDFGQPVDRRLTFRVEGMEAGKFIERFELRNIAVTGTFDGVVPMVFGESGGRIVGGRLRVREAGGTLAYVGEVSNADLGFFGGLAFDALKAMRYRSLAIELDGALDGDFVSRVLFDGTNQSSREAARGGLLKQFIGLPFRFNIVIRAPFRGLLNSAASLSDPTALVTRSLAEDALDAAPAAVVPPQSVQPE